MRFTPATTLHAPASPFTPRSLALAVLSTLSLCAPYAFAQTAAPATATAASGETQVAAQRVVPIVITGSRSARANEDVPATVSVITDEDIENKRIEDIKDLVREEPAVTVRRQPSRFTAAGSGTGRDGNAGFNIRGIDGNRVLIQVDGIRIPSAFSFGATNAGRGDYLDVSAVSRVEILRGPASALYGSDGLAGAVSFFTRDPSDLLRKFGGNSYVSASGSYSSDDKSFSETLSAALRLDRLEMMAVVNHREGHELKNFGTVGGTGTARTMPNPADSNGDGALLKWVYRIDPQQRIAVTLEKVRRSTDTDVLTGRIPVVGSTAVVSSLLAFDDSDRNRATVQHSIDGLGYSFANRLQWAVYAQDGRTRQFSAENRSNGVTRLRDQSYVERVTGLSAQAEKEITGPISHRIVYGIDTSWSDSVGQTTGTLPPAGETFPVKRFPDTAYNLIGAFIQDEIGFANNRVLLVPALRYDRYSLKPESSTQYPSGIPAASNDSHVTPKLGLVWKFGGGLSAFANLAAGYKAPSPSQVNQGFSNVVSNYQSIANPNLKPETNLTAEAGIRQLTGALTYEAAAYVGQYKDFIEQVLISGDFTAANPAKYQFVNLSKVRIRGAEAKLRYDISPQWSINAAAAYTKGTQETLGVSSPLLTINPLRVIGSVGYSSADARWGSDLLVVYSASKRLADVTPATQFRPPAATTLDLNAYWRVHKNAKLTAAVTNITDRKYWNWSDVQGLASTSTILDAYSQPGRAYSLGLKVEF